MCGLDYSTLKVGDEVAVARNGSRSIHSEGIYTVIKTNKLKVIVQRKCDGYERSFSVKRQCESEAPDRYRGAFLETVEVKLTRDAVRAAIQEVQTAWSNVEKAAQRKDISALRQALSDLERSVDKQ